MTLNTIGIGSIRLASENILYGFEVTALVINDTEPFECTMMNEEKWGKLMKWMEKRLEKTRSNKEVSDVSDFKCFLLQSRSPPNPLYFKALCAVTTFHLLNCVSSVSFLFYSHFPSREGRRNIFCLCLRVNMQDSTPFYFLPRIPFMLKQYSSLLLKALDS